MTETAIQERDEAIAEALTVGRSVRAVKREFGLSTDEIDAVLERLWPIDLQSRLRMIKTDLGQLSRLMQVFYEKALAGDVQSGLLTVRIWERKHELLGMNSAVKVQIMQEPAQAPDSFEKIYNAITRVANEYQEKRRNGDTGADELPPRAVDTLSISNGKKSQTIDIAALIILEHFFK